MIPKVMSHSNMTEIARIRSWWIVYHSLLGSLRPVQLQAPIFG
jgi:hypothetical protein